MRRAGMELSKRQEEIIQIVKQNEPIAADKIAEALGFTKSTIRTDLALLSMTGILDARPRVGYIFSGLEMNMPVTSLADKTVADIMTPAVNIYQDTSVYDAITSLFMYDTGSLFVLNAETQELAGIVSRKDLLRSIISASDRNIPVAIIMTRIPNVVTITPETPILEAARAIMRHEVNALPVVDRGDPLQVVGKVSKASLLNFLLDLFGKD